VSPLVLDENAASQAVDLLLRAFPIERPGAEAPESDEPPTGHTGPREAPLAGSERHLVEFARPMEEESGPPAQEKPVLLAASDELEGHPMQPHRLRPPLVSSAPADLVTVRCLGPFEVWRGQRILRKGWRNKARELLAYLIAHPSGAPKDRIIEELWPGIDPGEASERFDRMASEVRSRVRGAEDTARYVDKEDEVFYLEPGMWWADAWELERLVPGEREEDQDEKVRRLQEAVALYHGEFCHDYYYPWAEGVRERFRALAVRACARLADLLSDRREYDEAIAVLDRGIEADPVCEDLSRRAMAIEASLGRRAAALTRYRKLEATLDAELGVEPDPETQALASQLQADSEAG
jgi:DNA-binding SARP family transcriptional activator